MYFLQKGEISLKGTVCCPNCPQREDTANVCCFNPLQKRRKFTITLCFAALTFWRETKVTPPCSLLTFYREGILMH